MNYIVLKFNKLIGSSSIALFCTFLLSGCYNVPKWEYAEFTPMTYDKRIMNKVRLNWEVRPDAAEYCLQAHKGRDQAFNGTPVACAKWSQSTHECTIVTGPNPDHAVLGHEVRHCFEGHFH